MIAILGGGISGLAAAYELQKAGKDFILLEGENHLGGKIKSTSIEGFQLEMGPNTVLINNVELMSLLDELNLNEHIIKPDSEAVKNRFVIKKGKIEAIPNSLSSAFKSNLFGIGTLYRIFSEPFRKASKSEKEESLADFSRRRFGKQIYRDFITPFVSGIYAGDPEKMSVNHTLSILKEAEEKHGSVLKGMMKIMKAKKQDPNNQSLPKEKIFTFKRGLAFLIDSIKEKIQSNVELNAKIVEIKFDDGKYIIVYQQANEIKELEVEKVISTLPAKHLAGSIKGINAELAQQLTKVNYVPAVVLHLAVEKSSITFNQKAFGLLSRKEEDVPFLGLLFNSRFFPHTAPQDKELFTIICGGYKQPNILNEKTEDIHTKVDKALMKLNVTSSNSHLLHVQKWPDGIPQYEVGYGAIKKSIEDFHHQQKNFYIAGNFFGGVSVSDCVSNARNLARKLV